VVIHNLNFIRIAVTPFEADAPLIIDANAVRPGTIALQQFELISRRHAQILQPPRLMKIQKLSPCSPFDGLKSADHAVLKKRCGVGALEDPYQIPVYDV
jgi:hypothetical protein